MISRAKTFKGIRRAAAALLNKIFHDAAEAETIENDDLIDTLKTWTAALCGSALRSFRHTSTLVVLWMLQSLSTLRESAQNDLEIAERQRDAEVKKASPNKTRVAHTQQKMDQLETLCNFLETHLESLASDSLVDRFRDFDAGIRLDCVDQLGGWMQEFPERYLQPAYLEYLSRALSDPDAPVRLSVLRSVQRLFGDDTSDMLATFMRNTKRVLITLALGDEDMKVRVAAFGLLRVANEHGMLDNEDRSTLAVHVFDVEEGVRVAAAAFLAGLVEHDLSATLAHDAPGNVDLLRVRSLVKLLLKYNEQLNAVEGGDGSTHPDADADAPLATPGLGRIRVAVEALWDATETMHGWAPYIDILLDEQIAAPPASQGEAAAPAALTAPEEAVAVEMAVSIVQLTKAHNEGIADGISPIEACSSALITALPKLLGKYTADAPRITDLLLIIPAMDLDVYQEMRNADASESLWEQVCSHFMRHVEPDLLHNAAEAIRLLSSSVVSMSTSAARLQTLEDTLMNRLQDALHDRNIDTAVFSEDDAHTIRATLLRLYALSKTVDMSGSLDKLYKDRKHSTWEQILRLSARGRLGYEHEVQVSGCRRQS